MKKENNKLIILMICIIVILVVLCALFATDTISFDSKNNEANNDNNQEVENKYIISYEDEVYISKNTNNIEISKNKRNIVNVKNDSNTESANLIQTKLNEISDFNWNKSIKPMADSIALDSANYDNLGVNYLFETGEINDNRLTFIANMSGSFGGAAWTSNEGYNFDAKTGELLDLSNIGTGVYDYLYNRSINEIENNKKENSCLDNDWKNKVKESLNVVGNWYFTKDGIRVVFQKESIGCSTQGITYIDVDKSDINSYLKDAYKIN